MQVIIMPDIILSNIHETSLIKQSRKRREKRITAFEDEKTTKGGLHSCTFRSKMFYNGADRDFEISINHVSTFWSVLNKLDFGHRATTYCLCSTKICYSAITIG
ncbi:hypothetical protein ACJX0J_039280, partial [Zea mays]